MTNSLQMDGEALEDLFMALGVAFGVPPQDGLDRAPRTVGEVENWLLAQLAVQDGPCMTGAAFFRLRAGLGGDRSLRPTTRLTGLADGHPRQFFRRLARTTDLAMPPGRLSSLATVLSVLLFFLLPLGLFANQYLHRDILTAAAFAAWPAMIAIITFDRGRLPEGVDTLADLAREVAPLNTRKLAGQGQAVRRETLWDTLAGVLAQYGRGVPAAGLDRETRLMATVH